jgi:hypothetical protein
MSSEIKDLKQEESKSQRERYIPLDLDKILENIKENFSKKLEMSQQDLEQFNKIERDYHGLNEDVDKLGVTIQKILDKQYEEYVKTFIKFMDTVRDELRKKQEQMEEEFKKHMKENDIRIIKSERDFFRLEAIRLNGLCKEMSKKIEEMAFKMKLMNNDLSTMSVRWKESENINKQLIVELESNIQSAKDIEKENEDLKEKLNKNLNEIQNENYDNKNDDIYNVLKSDKALIIIERLKNDLRKERQRNHQTLSEFNKILLNKNKLETLFNECVEEVRKDVFNRKLKETMNETLSKRLSRTNNQISIPYLSDMKNDKFLPKDKRKILEMFLMKDDLGNILQNIVFNKPQDDVDKFGEFNILDENRIQTPIGKLNLKPMNSDKKKNNVLIKSSYNFSNSFGKKTSLNFGNIKVKLNPFKYNISGL